MVPAVSDTVIHIDEALLNAFNARVKRYSLWVLSTQCTLLPIAFFSPWLFFSLSVLKFFVTVGWGCWLLSQAPAGPEGEGYEDEEDAEDEDLAPWEQRDRAYEAKWSDDPKLWPRKSVGWF